MRAPKVHTDRNGGLNVKSFPDQGPTLTKVFLRTRQLEVIHVNYQVQLESRMKVARLPLFTHKFESNTLDMIVTMNFPHGAAVRMAVKCAE